MAALPKTSARFRKAASAERDRLLRQRAKANEKVQQLRDQLRSAENWLDDLDGQISALQDLAEEPRIHAVATRPQGEGRSRGSATVLKGAAIREMAVQILLDSEFANRPIHYRDWLELVQTAGYEIEGRRPDAVFLNQIVRASVVKTTTTAGVYELDLETESRLERELRRLKGALGELTARDTHDAQELDDLTREIRKTERALAEAQRCLGATLTRKAA